MKMQTARCTLWAVPLVALLLLPTNGHAESRPLRADTLLGRADLLADLGILERAYRALHPGLFRYNTPTEVDQLFANARAEFTRDRTLADTWIVLTRLTAALRCGHSYPNPSNQSKAVRLALFESLRLPFYFRWLDGKMIITRNLSGGSGLGAGTRVERIGHVATSDMLAALLPLARADGSNDGKRRAYLSVTGESSTEAFDVLAPLLFPHLFQGPDVQLELLALDGTTTQLTTPLQTASQRNQSADATTQADPPANVPLWHREWIKQANRRVVYLRMPTWVAYKTKWDWKADLDTLMAELVSEKADGLVVDLRGNEGGNDIGDVLLAHLIKAPLQRAAMVRRVRFATVPGELRPVLETWDPSFFELGKEARTLPDGWRELPQEVGSDVIAPRAPRFGGRVVVMTDESNSSATFQFALAVQRAHLGTLVGAATGGSQRGINGGAFFFVQLPRTHLEVDLPLIGTFPSEPAPDAGVSPDIAVAATAADLASGRDATKHVALDVASR